MASYGLTFILILKLFLFVLVTGHETHTSEQKDKHYWHSIGRSELLAAFMYSWNTNNAKNVIIFLGDGMSSETITSSRVNHSGEEGYLAWERFPHIGLLKTYDSHQRVPDSGSTATALFCGVKTNYKVVGVDSNVRRYDCEASLKEENQLHSIFNWAQAAGKHTGFVTTGRITQATTAALYAHTADKDWECEEYMPESAAKCKDIARQLIEDQPGKNIKVIMGGGRQVLQSHCTARDGDPIDPATCYRKDGRRLMDDWAADKAHRKLSHTVVQNNKELCKVDPKKTNYLLGVFANSYMSMDSERDTSPEGQPSLQDMTTTAIKILRKSKKGFILVVEAGLIDFAYSNGHTAQALQETVRLSEAINATLELVDTDETLIIVTSNHGPAMNFACPSSRRANVVDINDKSTCDNSPHTILGYTPQSLRNMVSEAPDATTEPEIKDSSEEDTAAITFSQNPDEISEEITINAIDIAVYAIGPYAHFFHTTHEQNFVAHVVAYAAEIREFSMESRGTTPTTCFLILLVVVLPIL